MITAMERRIRSSRDLMLIFSLSRPLSRWAFPEPKKQALMMLKRIILTSTCSRRLLRM